MIAVLLAVAASAADGLPLRVIDDALVGGEIRLPDALRGELQTAFEREIREAWPEAAEAGDAREGGTIRASADPIVHVGLRVSRFEEDRFAVGTEKTVEVLRATLAPFAVDLGTGEIVASSPWSFVVTGERVGTDTASDADDLRSALVTVGVPRAVERFADGFAPDRLTAPVLARDKAGAYVERGSLSGSFVGERLRTATGEIVEVIEVGDRVSRVISPTGAPLPDAGAELVRPGLARPLGEAPRVLVAVPDAPSPGPDGESVTMWVEEALAQAGWVVVPRGTELFGAQLRAASRLDIPEESLLNAQTPPERVAVPRLWRLTTASAADPSGTARLAVAAGLQVDVFDLSSGLLVQSVPVVERRDHDTRVEVLDPFAAAMQVSVVKDAASVLAADPAAAPSPALAPATIEKTRSDGVAWTPTAAPLPAGVIGEVTRPRTFPDPATGQPLDGPAERIGVARVLGLDGEWLTAGWIAPGPARRGDRFVAVGGREGGPPVAITPPIVEGDELGSGMAEVARAGLHRGEGLSVVATGADADALDGVVVKVARSGFAGRVQREPVAATRQLATRFRVTVERTAKGRKQTVTIRVDAQAEVTRDGEPVLLKPPSADEAAPVYTMWSQQALELPKSKGRNLTVVDLDGAIRETVHQTAATLGTRVAVMLGG